MPLSAAGLQRDERGVEGRNLDEQRAGQPVVAEDTCVEYQHSTLKDDCNSSSVVIQTAYWQTREAHATSLAFLLLGFSIFKQFETSTITGLGHCPMDSLALSPRVPPVGLVGLKWT